MSTVADWRARAAAALSASDRGPAHGEHAAALGEARRRRVATMLIANSAAIIATGLLWITMFSLQGQWMTVFLQGIAVAAAIATVLLVRRRKLREASQLLLPVLYLLICFGSIWVDTPSPAVSRSIHTLLVPVGVMAFLLMREEPPWQQKLVPLMFFLTFAAFSAFDLGIPSAISLPDSLRVHTAWVNHLVAALMLYVSLRLVLADVAESTAEEGELRESLLRGEFLLHYQPQVDTQGHVIGAEALIRWNHPRRGLVSPGDFIPAAERCGLMLPIGDWVVSTACTTLVRWSRRPETASLLLAINVSMVQFTHPDFVARMLAIIEESGADPRLLKLEITESMLAKDVDDIVAKMTELKSHGIGFSLDDFGTGFSSLSYLRRLPLDQLKIDKSFVRNMLSSRKDLAIAEAVVSLGRNLDLKVIAEGVETPEQHQFLHGIGCGTFQGYLFSKPVPEEQFVALLARGAMMPAVQPAADELLAAALSDTAILRIRDGGARAR